MWENTELQASQLAFQKNESTYCIFIVGTVLLLREVYVLTPKLAAGVDFMFDSFYQFHKQLSKMGDSVDEHPSCRLCHEEEKPTSPLYSPCKCSGSMKYVHHDCLTDWLRLSNKLELKCEVCSGVYQFHGNSFSPAATAWTSTMTVMWNRGLFVLQLIPWICLIPLLSQWWFELCWSWLIIAETGLASTEPRLGIFLFWIVGIAQSSLAFFACGLLIDLNRVSVKRSTAIQSLF